MYTTVIKNMDIAMIADSGQAFRFRRIPDRCDDNTVTYALIAFGRYLEISQSGETFTFSCSEEEWDIIWRSYFDLDTDYESIGNLILSSGDDYLIEAYNRGRGVRILRQDLWEMIVTFMISQNNNIKRIGASVDKLCVRSGVPLQSLSEMTVQNSFENGAFENGTLENGAFENGAFENGTLENGTLENGAFENGAFKNGAFENGAFAFPAPGEVPMEIFEDKGMGFGYRAEYLSGIYTLAKDNPEWMDRLRTMTYDEAMEALLAIKGIGKKVANCICLFGLHHIDAFPIDTHVKQILAAHYPDGFDFERYKGVAGIVQQYMFYNKISG